MYNTGIVAIATPDGRAVDAKLISRENFDGFVIDLLADGKTLDIDENPDDGSAIVQVTCGRRPYKLTYTPVQCLYAPTFKLDDMKIKEVLARQKPKY